MSRVCDHEEQKGDGSVKPGVDLVWSTIKAAQLHRYGLSWQPPSIFDCAHSLGAAQSGGDSLEACMSTGLDARLLTIS